MSGSASYSPRGLKRNGSVDRAPGSFITPGDGNVDH
jgi:hypothetical protein